MYTCGHNNTLKNNKTKQKNTSLASFFTRSKQAVLTPNLLVALVMTNNRKAFSTNK